MKTWGWRLELKYKKIDPDEVEYKRIAALYSKLQTSLGLSLPGHLHLLASEKLKAFLLPTGDLYLTTGSVKGLSDNDLTCLIAHELAHMQLQHSQELLGYSKPTLLWAKWMSMKDHHTSDQLRTYLVARKPFTEDQEHEAV